MTRDSIFEMQIGCEGCSHNLVAVGEGKETFRGVQDIAKELDLPHSYSFREGQRSTWMGNCVIQETLPVEYRKDPKCPNADQIVVFEALTCLLQPAENLIVDKG